LTAIYRALTTGLYRQLTVSALVVAGGFLLSKILGLGREILIARAFGTSGVLDAYYAAFNFPDLLFALIPGGALASVFIPVLASQSTRDGADAGWKFASIVVNDVFLSVAVLSALGALFAQPIVANVIAPGFDPERQALASDLMRIVFVSTTIFAVSGVVLSILHAHQHFILPALAPALYNLGIIGGAVWLAPIWGIYGLAYGVLAGSILHLAIQVPGLIHFRARYYPALGTTHAGLHELVRLFGPRVVTLAVVRANFLILTNLASRLGEGSVSALNYAYLLMQFPESLIGTAIALAVFPTLSQLAAQNESAQLRRLFYRSLAVILILATVAAVVFVLWARPIVQIVLQRGAFGTASVDAVAFALQFYALAIVGESALEICARIFYAQHDAKTPLWVALSAMVVNLLLSLTLIGPLGIGGLVLARAVGLSWEAGWLLYIAHARWFRRANPSVTSKVRL
jgi:putative peptidoglycan lipid II flippase